MICEKVKKETTCNMSDYHKVHDNKNGERVKQVTRKQNYNSFGRTSFRSYHIGGTLFTLILISLDLTAHQVYYEINFEGSI